MTYNILNSNIKTKRTPLIPNNDNKYVFYEINSTYYKFTENNTYYIHSFILTVDESTKEEVKLDVTFNLELLEETFNIETFLMYNLPDILSTIDGQKSQIPEHLFDLENFRHICYSYSSEIEPIEHVFPKNI